MPECKWNKNRGSQRDLLWGVGFRAELSRFFHREVSHLKYGFLIRLWSMGLAFSPLFCAAAAELALKRKLSFPVSRMWQRVCQPIEQSGRHLGVAKDEAHSLKLRLVVMMKLVRS